MASSAQECRTPLGWPLSNSLASRAVSCVRPLAHRLCCGGGSSSHQAAPLAPQRTPCGVASVLFVPGGFRQLPRAREEARSSHHSQCAAALHQHSTRRGRETLVRACFVCCPAAVGSHAFFDTGAALQRRRRFPPIRWRAGWLGWRASATESIFPCKTSSASVCALCCLSSPPRPRICTVGGAHSHRRRVLTAHQAAVLDLCLPACLKRAGQACHGAAPRRPRPLTRSRARHARHLSTVLEHFSSTRWPADTIAEERCRLSLRTPSLEGVDAMDASSVWICLRFSSTHKRALTYPHALHWCADLLLLVRRQQQRSRGVDTPRHRLVSEFARGDRQGATDACHQQCVANDGDDDKGKASGV